MISATLFGWDKETWQRVAKWADWEPPSLRDMMDESKRPYLSALRLKWMKAGGPMVGPKHISLE